MLLLALVVIGFLSLAAVEVRRSAVTSFQEEAKANARLALMIALGEMQRELGPDQRVTGTTALLGLESGSQRHWTTSWDTRQEDGSSFYYRDEFNDGLRDAREEGWDAQQEARAFLVSGNEGGESRVGAGVNPDDMRGADWLRIVGQGSVGGFDAEDEVWVKKMGIAISGKRDGNYAWWVGDLGVKANVATRNAYEDGRRMNDYIPLLAAQESEPLVMGAGELMREEVKGQMVGEKMIELLSGTAKDWSQELFHDVTVTSRGVLSDVRGGGLKKNLTAYLNDDGTSENLTVSGEMIDLGVSDDDRMVSYLNPLDAQRQGADWDLSRFSQTAPRFSILKEWARFSSVADFDDRVVDSKRPPSEESPRIPDIAKAGFQNLNPAALASPREHGLAPILVEGSMYTTFSYHPNPADWEHRYNIRSHLYPRVVLWNPYNVPITFERSMILLQVNGRRGFNTDIYDDFGRFLGVANWLVFGGRQFEATNDIINSEMFIDPYTGSFYFALPRTVFQPGDCLVFSAAKAMEYDGELENNLLSCEVEPNPSINFYQSSSEFGDEGAAGTGGFDWVLGSFWYAPSVRNGGQWEQKTQADDAQMMLKSLKDASGVTPVVFDTLPLIQSVSCSLQYGDGREPVEAWNDLFRVPIERTALSDPVLRLKPDRRTRQGYRLRWFEEHASNTQISGDPLRDEPYWDEAFIANWNLRAAYATRSPWENVGGEPGDEEASGPWFFGAYTRDLYDQAVGWDDQRPVLGADGRYHGNPFGTPIEGQDRYILYDVPKSGVGVVSMGQLQHAKFSEFVWHPSYAVGNSLAETRLGSEGLISTVPKYANESERDQGGFSAQKIGWPQDGERGSGMDSWARFGRALYQDYPETDNLVYDLSFEMNHTLWDRYFFSSGTGEEISRFVASPVQEPLPNGRMILSPLRGKKVDARELNDLHQAAARLLVDGAFNVNSTSVEAWKALLSANRDGNAQTRMPRVLNAPDVDWRSGDSTEAENVWSGSRVLSDEEVENLAVEIVEEVKNRGPFLSLSDFVNRRLSNDETGRKGAIQAAIDRAGLNQGFDTNDTYRIENEVELNDYDHPDQIADSTLHEQTLKPNSKAWGATTYLTQADVLQSIGSVITARSDTFVIRAYGDATDNGGRIQARAWCEAVIQRVPEPVHADASGINPDMDRKIDFGRKFRIVSFRWLNPSEV